MTLGIVLLAVVEVAAVEAYSDAYTGVRDLSSSQLAHLRAWFLSEQSGAALRFMRGL